MIDEFVLGEIIGGLLIIAFFIWLAIKLSKSRYNIWNKPKSS
ncbi:MAG: hypothetical protein QW625_02605 [Candidatus Nanoarchaeia archaeon]